MFRTFLRVLKNLVHVTKIGIFRHGKNCKSLKEKMNNLMEGSSHHFLLVLEKLLLKLPGECCPKGSLIRGNLQSKKLNLRLYLSFSVLNVL